MMSEAEITFVVVNYNTKYLLRECLVSIETYTHIPYLVVVIDNASADGSAEMVRTNFSRFQLIANSKNLGFPHAVNQGLQAADTPYYFVLNSDIRLTNTTLLSLIDHMNGSPKTSIAAPAQVSPDGEPMMTVYRDPTLGREFVRNLLFADIWQYRFREAVNAQHYHLPTLSIG